MSDDRRAGPSVLTVPEGDDRERLTCPDCGFVRYDNPKVVIGAVAVWQDRILMCKRAIEPRTGKWTLPAGYLELNETSAEGAMRETWEEACARIEIDALLAVYDIPRISQVQMFFRARLLSPDIAAGAESLAVELFDWERIPWDELAFPSVTWALQHYAEVKDKTEFAPRRNPVGASSDLTRSGRKRD